MLAWDVHAFTHQPLRIFDANTFYPLPRTLAYQDNLIGSALVAAPVMWLTGNPVLGLNVVSLVACMLCGLGGYMLGRRLGMSAPAAVLCGFIFAFCPARFFRVLADRARAGAVDSAHAGLAARLPGRRRPPAALVRARLLHAADADERSRRGLPGRGDPDRPRLSFRARRTDPGVAADSRLRHPRRAADHAGRSELPAISHEPGGARAAPRHRQLGESAGELSGLADAFSHVPDVPHGPRRHQRACVRIPVHGLPADAPRADGGGHAGGRAQASGRSGRTSAAAGASRSTRPDHRGSLVGPQAVRA